MLKLQSCMLALLVSLTGCTNTLSITDSLTDKAGLSRTTINTANFKLTAYQRVTRSDRPLSVYIEGDGLSWINRTTPSADPTPLNPVGLMLAAADPGPNVLYLARPCQYTPMPDNPLCRIAYWTDRRFSKEVIDSLDQAIDRYTEQIPERSIDLIGYSGGGALVVLIAAKRHDVRTIRTVAGNLDQVEINRLHDVAPMPGSKNAIDVAHAVSHIPQIHFSGSNDQTVPPMIAEHFAAVSDSSCVQTRVVSGMTHSGDWARQWPTLLAIIPVC